MGVMHALRICAAVAGTAVAVEIAIGLAVILWGPPEGILPW